MSSIAGILSRIRIDGYALALLCTAGFATLVPARDSFADALDIALKIAISLLFFLYGSRMSTAEAWQGLRNWRLHLLILLATFGCFPLLGLTGMTLLPTLLPDQLYTGVLFLCLLPSTVQSSIALTSLARGNVPSAVCAASLSNVLGVVLTPLLVGVLLATHGEGFAWQSARDILLLLLVPFLLGQAAHPWLISSIQRHGKPLGYADRGVILAVVYSAFSDGVVSGVWQRITPLLVGVLLLICVLLLVVMLVLTDRATRWLGFARADRIVVLLCGSQKSLASGIPMATLLFSPEVVSLVVLPLMLYHQLQLIGCAWLARRFGQQPVPDAANPSVQPSRGTR